MKAKTYRERLEAGLPALGYVRVDYTPTSKYTKWMHPDLPSERSLFVGKNGALRIGRTVTESMSLCDAASYKFAIERGTPLSRGPAFYKRVLEHGDGQQVLAVLAEAVAKKDLQ